MTGPFQVEGVDYSPEGVAALRQALVEMRGSTFKHWPEAIDHTVVLTHAIALLSYLIELQRQMEPVDWPQVARNILEAMQQVPDTPETVEAKMKQARVVMDRVRVEGEAT